MCCSSSSADLPHGPRGRRAPRGLTLLELLISQVIVAIVVAGMFALVAAQTRTYHSGWGASEAQTRLREATHVVLRELQGLGGEEGQAGDLVLFVDGGAAASDDLTFFLPDYSICGGLQAVTGVDDEELELDDSQDLSLPADGSPDCPLGTLPGCSATDLVGRTVLVRGQNRSAHLTISTLDIGDCEVEFQNGDNSASIAAYNSRWGTSFGNTEDVIGNLGNVEAILMGSTMTFSVDDSREMLQRKVNNGSLVDVLPGVADLQVQFSHDINVNDLIESGEWDATGALAGATPDNFFGVRFGMVTFGGSTDGIEAPPPVFGNRDLSALPGARRYRYSFHFAAARNR